jgi:hypothetical protein
MYTHQHQQAICGAYSKTEQIKQYTSLQENNTVLREECDKTEAMNFDYHWKSIHVYGVG